MAERKEADGQGSVCKKTLREIRRKTRRRFSAEEKLRILLEGLRDEESIATERSTWTGFPSSAISPPSSRNLAQDRPQAARRRHRCCFRRESSPGHHWHHWHLWDRARDVPRQPFSARLRRAASEGRI